MLGYRGIRTNAILIHQADQICLCEQGRSCRFTLPELADGGHKLFSFLKGRQLVARPLVVGKDFEVVPLENQ